jgi:hypothetical protein
VIRLVERHLYGGADRFEGSQDFARPLDLGYVHRADDVSIASEMDVPVRQ